MSFIYFYRIEEVEGTLKSLKHNDVKILPSVAAVKITCRFMPSAFLGTVSLIDDQVQNISNSVVAFGYERPDQADLTWIRKTFKLDEACCREQR